MNIQLKKKIETILTQWDQVIIKQWKILIQNCRSNVFFQIMFIDSKTDHGIEKRQKLYCNF